MNWRMLGAPEFRFGIWFGAGALASKCAFFLDSEYSPKDPRTSTFFLCRPDGVGLDLDLRRWRVFPFFSVLAK